MSIKQTILNEAQKEVDQIIKEAQELYQLQLSKNKEKTDIKIANLKSNAKKEQARVISEKEIELENDIKKLVLEEKNKQIDRVLQKLKEHILNLNDNDFFKYVVRRIQAEELQGNEIMRVRKTDYQRFLKLFSSETKGKTVVLDILNKELGKNFNLKLEDQPVNIENGFLLIGTYYDLNFSVEPLIDNIKRTTEKQIHDILYK